jgi:hypothetical protein
LTFASRVDLCSKYLAKNIPLDRLLTEFKQDQDDTSPCDSGSEDLADDEGLRNDAAAAPGSGADMAASPGYSHSEDGTDDVGAVKVNDTLGYCQVRRRAAQTSQGITCHSLLLQHEYHLASNCSNSTACRCSRCNAVRAPGMCKWTAQPVLPGRCIHACITALPKLLPSSFMFTLAAAFSARATQLDQARPIVSVAALWLCAGGPP